jgi:hypothetical protein
MNLEVRKEKKKRRIEGSIESKGGSIDIFFLRVIQALP